MAIFLNQIKSHQCILPPFREAVVHRDLLAFCDVSDRYDDQADLSPAVDFSYPAVGRRVEKHGSSDAARPLVPQLWHAEKHKQTRSASLLKLQVQLFEFY